MLYVKGFHERKHYKIILSCYLAIGAKLHFRIVSEDKRKRFLKENV